MKTRAMIVAACVAAFLAGCSSNKSADTKTASKTADKAAAPKQASMGVVNTKCPIMPSHPATAKSVKEFNGQKVGFCCEGCYKKWDAMSDAEKADALKKAM
ncbi:MAG: hypothetical protein JSR77_08495 [Planctomycetes bacterium]|nr:hypothetical protein [Planctomycetota bacterium]